MKEEFNTVLFIGNGFDRALGFPTAYSHFMKNKYFKELTEKENSLCEYIEKKGNSLNEIKWVDIECELYNYSKFLDKTKGKNNEEEAQKFEEEYHALRKALQTYICEINAPIKNEENSKKFNDFFSKLFYTEKKDITKSCIINFNYSQFLWVEISNDKDYFDENHVHGSLNISIQDKKNKIVFGIDESMKVNPLHCFLYKSFDNNIKIEGFKEMICNVKKYIFYGCSFGITDKWYYDIVLKQKNKEYDIYCYKPEGVKYIKNRILELNGSLQNFRMDNTVHFFDSETLKELEDE